MYRTLIISFFLLLPSAPFAAAEESAPAANLEPETRAVKGMSVLGNNEAPMSLVIVPWKGSDLGVETNLTRTLNERDVPVDREVFRRELGFYQVSVEGKPQATALNQ